MYVQNLTVNLTTTTGGGATGYSDVVTGRVSMIRYVRTDFASTADFTLTSERTGATIWAESNVAASATRAPRQATHGTNGVAALYATGGAAVLAPIDLAADRVKVVVAQGGNTKTGAIHLTFV